MIKNTVFILFLALLSGSYLSAAETEPEEKYLVILADYGGKPPPDAVLLELKKNPEIKIAVVWDKELAVPEVLKQLAKEKQAELVLVLSAEPIMPLVYNTEISTPVAIKFSAPEDIWDIIVRAKEEFRQSVQLKPRGLHIRSGAFSWQLASGFKKLGLSWASVEDVSGFSCGAFARDGFVIISARSASFSDANEYWKWANSAQGRFPAAIFNEEQPLTAEFISELADFISGNKNIKLVLPEQVAAKYKDNVPDAEGVSLELDVSAWKRSPIVWYELSVARKAMEDYKNSGSADLTTLGKLRNELYRLYDYKLIAALSANPASEQEEYFQKGIADIFGILGLPVDESIKALPGLQQTRPLSIEIEDQCLAVINSVSLSAGKNINQFFVTVAPASISYFIDLDTSVVQGALAVDIYMDLNNQEGAGLTKMLPGTNGFMETNDAWEYALRIENEKAELYRAGRFVPVLVKKFNMQIPWELEIPRNLLRGNPLKWGYQVITATKQAEGLYAINDFLAKDNEERQKYLNDNPVQLPAVRVQTRSRDKKRESAVR